MLLLQSAVLRETGSCAEIGEGTSPHCCCVQSSGQIPVPEFSGVKTADFEVMKDGIK